MTTPTTNTFIPTGEATAILPARNSKDTPITVIGTGAIRKTFDAMCVTQAETEIGGAAAAVQTSW